MVTYADTFAVSSANLHGRPLESGGLAWQVVDGVWSVTGSKPATTSAASTNPLAVIDPGKSDADITLSVGQDDAIYFRVVDADNWLRLVAYYRTSTTYTSADQWYGTYGHGSLHSSPPGPPVSGNDTVTTHQLALPGQTPSFSSTLNVGHPHEAASGATSSHSHDYALISTGKTGNTGSIGHTSESHGVHLEQCVGGVVTRLGSRDTSRVNNLRVIARQNNVTCYANGSKVIEVASSQFISATKHGFGRGSHSSSSSSANIDNFSLATIEPPTPLLLYPQPLSTVDRSRPILSARLGSYDILAKMQWQIATDAAFTVNLKTITQTDADRKPGESVVSYELLDSEKLAKGVWFLRAREVDANSANGPWTDTISFTVAHVPNVVNMTPTGGQGVGLGSPTHFQWAFADSDPYDGQTARQIVLERNDTGALVFDTAKVVDSKDWLDYTVPANLLGVELRWKIRVWDKEDTAGPYTGYSYFTMFESPNVVITSPTNGSEVSSGNPVFSWTFDAAGRTQASYRVLVTNLTTGQVVWDTGVRSGQVNLVQPATSILSNDKNYRVLLSVVDSSGITKSIYADFISIYIAPQPVDFLADGEVYETHGYVAISWDSDPDPDFIRWRLYFRAIDDDEWSVRTEIFDPNAAEYRDYLVPSQGTYQYSLLQVVRRFGEEVESEISNPVTITVGTGGWWLIDQVVHADSVQLHSVKEANYQSNRERAEFIVVDRGRHVQVGQNAGRTGSISAQLRDSEISGTARAKKKRLEAMIDTGEAVWLRDPYGEIILVSPGDLSVGYVAGSGPAEHVDVTFPYSEVF